MPSVKRLITGLTAGLLDLLYPPKCLVCGELGPHYLCPRCAEGIRELGAFVCRRCGAPIEEGYCRECRGRELYFDSARSVAIYEGVLREAIHQLKYSLQTCLVPDLGRMMVDFCRSFPQNLIMKDVDAVVYVPIDRSRHLERGFSQSRMLAEYVAEAYGLSIINDALVRTRKAPPQSSLSLDQRLVNLQGVFAVGSPNKVMGLSLLLIDDVYTTGSTVNEAAKALKDAGAGRVHVLTLARSL